MTKTISVDEFLGTEPAPEVVSPDEFMGLSPQGQGGAEPVQADGGKSWLDHLLSRGSPEQALNQSARSLVEANAGQSSDPRGRMGFIDDVQKDPNTSAMDVLPGAGYALRNIEDLDLKDAFDHVRRVQTLESQGKTKEAEAEKAKRVPTMLSTAAHAAAAASPPPPWAGADWKGWEVPEEQKGRTYEDSLKLAEQYIQDLDAYQKEAEARGTTFGAKVGKGAMMLLPYMADITATGAFYKAASSATRVALKNVMGRAIKNRAVSAGVTAASWVAGSTARTLLTGGTGANITRRLKMDAMSGEGKPYSAALYGFLDQFAENAGEVVGERVIKIASKFPVVGQAIKKLNTGLTNLMGAGWRSQVKKAGYDGLLAEIGEERVSDLMRLSFGITDFKSDPNKPAWQNVLDGIASTVPGFEDFMVEVAVLSIPTAAGALMGGKKAAAKPLSQEEIATNVAKAYGLAPENALAAVQRAHGRKGDIQTNLAREIHDEMSVSDDGLAVFAEDHPQAATELAGIEKPSRADFERLGLPRRSATDRARIAESLRGLIGDQTTVEAAQASQEAPGGAITPEAFQEAAPEAAGDKIEVTHEEISAERDRRLARQKQSLQTAGSQELRDQLNENIRGIEAGEADAKYEADIRTRKAGERADSLLDHGQTPGEAEPQEVKTIFREKTDKALENISKGIPEQGVDQLGQSLTGQGKDIGDVLTEIAAAPTRQEASRVLHKHYPDSGLATNDAISNFWLASKTGKDTSDFVRRAKEAQRKLAEITSTPRPKSPARDTTAPERAAEDIPPAADLASVSADDLDAIINEVVAEKQSPVSPTVQPQAAEKNKGLKQADKVAPESLKRGNKQADASAAAIAGAAKHGVKGVSEAVQGLAELFGLSETKMNTGLPVNVNGETYAKAKPHFQAALKEFVAAGKSLKDFVRWAVGSFGASIRPYLQAFRADLAGGDNEQKESSDGHANDSGTDQGGSAPADNGPDGEGASPAGVPVQPVPAGEPGKAKADQGADSDVPAAQQDDGGSGEVAGVLPSSMGVAGQPATGGGGGDVSAPGPGSNGVVPAATGGDSSGSVRPDASVVESGGSGVGNYDLREKPPIRLTRKGRKEMNAKAKAILAKSADAITAEDRDVLRQYTGEGGLSSGTKEALNQHYTDYPVIRSMFKALQDAGVKLNKLLEPGAGSGNFVGHAPGADWTTVDIDETNHRVLSVLYPDAHHYHMSYEDFTAGGFDAVLCNVPFLETRGAGRSKDRPDIKALHDFYFVHSLDRVKPNGVIAFVTSTGTMDKLDSSIRKEIVDKADVIGAFRLPGETFSENAHTDVITDIIFLQRRPDGVAARSDAKARNDLFVSSTKTSDDIALNEWYQAHPDAVLGQLVAGKNKLYGGRPAYEVHGPARLDGIAVNYQPYGQAQESGKSKGKKGDTAEAPTTLQEFTPWAKDNHLVTRMSTAGDYAENIIIQDGTAYASQQEVQFEDVAWKAKIYAPMTGSIAEKILALHAIVQDASRFQGGDESAAADGIEAIGEYRKRFEKAPHEDRQLRKVFRDNDDMVFYSEMTASFDKDFTPADVFVTQTRHSDSGRIQVTENDTLRNQAVAAEDSKGRITFPTAQGFVAEGDVPDLLSAGYALAGYEDGKPIIQNDILYYSGNIYQKLSDLDEARRAAPKELRPFLDTQEARLREVMPAPKAMAEISIKGTEEWLVPFIKQARIGITSAIDKETGMRVYSVDAYSAGLTMDEAKVFERHLANHRLANRATINGEQESMGSYMRRLHLAEEDLRSAISKIRNRLSENDALRAKIEEAFNSRFRNYVKPDYAKAQYLIQDVLDEITRNNPQIRDAKTGKLGPLQLRRNQVAWVVQSLYEGRGINAHDVGGGKTMAAIILARALKRRGRAQKPMFTVPAKTIKTWVKTTKLLFPDSKVIDLGNLSKDHRSKALFDLANTNADFVFISHEGFGNVQLPADIEAQYVQDAMDEHVDDPEASGRQAALISEKAEAYKDALLHDGRDTRLTWDKLGIDCLIADEAHNFKNIGISNQLVRFGLGVGFGFNPDGSSLDSARSYDFRFKANYTTDHNNNSNVFLLTATPTPNKPMEIYTMLRHLGRDAFAEYGISNDRQFAAAFFQLGTVNDPSKNRPKSVLRAIVNAQELRGLLNRYVDKINMEDMPWIETPRAKETRVLLDQSDAYAIVAQDLLDRRGSLSPHPEKGDDTLVAIYTGGRSASVDPRLYGGSHAGVSIDARSMQSTDDKVQWTVEAVSRKSANSPDAGQLVFLDDSGHTQKARGVLAESLHREIKNELVARGMDPSQIAIINGQEITNPKTMQESSPGQNADARKAELQDAYNDGKIKVLIGSTTSMGEGMNLQQTTTDIYHLDIPYTPGAIRQRNGRGVRPGNRNNEVQIHYLLMRGSFDSTSLNIVQTKKGWNEAVWDKDVANTISTEEEMVAGVIPSGKQILLELEKDPIRRKALEIDFKLEAMRSQVGQWQSEQYAYDSRSWSDNRHIKSLEATLAERKEKLASLLPDEDIKDDAKRAQQFEASKKHLNSLIEATTRHISNSKGQLAKTQEKQQVVVAQIAAMREDIAALEARWLDDQGNIRVSPEDVSGDDSTGSDGVMDFPAGGGPAASAGAGTFRAKNLVQPADVVQAVRKMWPGLSVRGKATFSRGASGWYNPALGEMRTKDARDLDAISHELGHHFDRQLGMWSKSKGKPSGVPSDLASLGRELYGAKTPAAGYRAEGFAEFVRRCLMGEDLSKRVPDLHDWFTLEYLVKNPAEAKKLRTLSDLLSRLQAQTPEQAVRAFRQPLRKDWSVGRIAATVASTLENEIIDENLPLLRSMQATGADLDAIAPSDHPYMLATFYSRSAGGRAVHSVLESTTDLYGRETGIGLRQALAPVSEMGEDTLENWIDYAVAREALLRHSQGKDPGIPASTADAAVKQYRSPTFDKALKEVTDWNHRILHLRVESGGMTQAEYDQVVKENETYIPMFRQFAKGELRDGRKAVSGRLHRFKGSGREIYHPIDSMVAQAEKMISVSMRDDVLRSIVKFYDSHKGKVESLGIMLSEVPAPKEATTFTEEKIKKEMAAKAIQLGADPQDVEAAMMDPWDNVITVFTQSPEYRGKDNIIQVVVDGKRRFFEVHSNIAPMMEGMAKKYVLGGKLGELSRMAVRLQRLGATGINPAFGLIRNLIRDTLTAAVQSVYHFHIPILSTLHGMWLDLTGDQYSKLYHGSGLDLAGHVGQDLDARSVHNMSSRATAVGGLQKVWRAGILNGLREVLSHSEVGPRLMEYRGAHRYGMEKWGNEADAAVLAGCSAKDVTTNFTRAGSTGRAANEVVLFFNASVQSIEKFSRALGLREAMPWAKHKSRGATALRTLARAAAFVTLAALINYFRNRDEEWWKELPAHEKWGYIHVKMPGGTVIRIPLPFEHGSIFGALPAALLEDARTPGAFNEALSQSAKANAPVDLTSLHGVASNVAMLSPMADILANEDWTGRPIVPAPVEQNREPAEQYGPGTTWLSKKMGQVVGYSPARIEHVLNQYTGGLYRRMASAVETATDPSAVTAGKPSNLPVLGTLFLRPGTSRVVGGFYDRLGELQQKKGSGKATLEEIGDLAASQRLSRNLTQLWADRREAIASGKSAGEVDTETGKLLEDIQAKIREHNAAPAADRREAGIAAVAYAATDPKDASADDIATAKRLLADVPDGEIRKALMKEAHRRGMKVSLWTDGHKPTVIAKRLARLGGLKIGE